MDLLQAREKEIFETLNRLKRFKFVVIGGYAVNAYTLPRFSVDCDIVVEEYSESRNVGKELEQLGYVKADADKVNTPYHGKFIRYEKEIKSNFRVSIDILVKEILDRQTNSTFSAEWVFKNSNLRLLKGKTIIKELKLRIINAEALFVMKFVSGRISDIRDLFMIATQVKDIEWIKEEVTKRYDPDERFLKIKNKISSVKFKDNLQGVYGYIDNNLFERHKKALIRMGMY